MNTMQLIKTRKGVRTFDGEPISAEDKEKLYESVCHIPLRISGRGENATGQIYESRIHYVE